MRHQLSAFSSDSSEQSNLSIRLYIRDAESIGRSCAGVKDLIVVHRIIHDHAHDLQLYILELYVTLVIAIIAQHPPLAPHLIMKR
jgi:hypothetical protein